MNKQNNIAILYVPTASLQEAENVVQHLLHKRLIACAQIMPATSFYWWQGAINQSPEQIIIAKTIPEKADLVTEQIKKIHSYTTPCIATFVANVNSDYYQWVIHELEQSQ